MALSTRQTDSPRRSQAPQRWDSQRELEQFNEQFGRLMDTVWAPLAGGGNGAAWVPLADVEETEDAWTVEAELPAVSREDINVELRDNELVISGDIKEKERKGVLRKRTRRTGQFEYRVALPGQADEENIDAKLHEGVLTVRVPKSEGARRRRIEVQGG
jgi:HSP20 family protein